MYGGLRGLDGRFEEWVGLLGEEQREGYFHTVNTHIVDKHLALYEILLRPRICNRGEGVSDEFWI